MHRYSHEITIRGERIFNNFNASGVPNNWRNASAPNDNVTRRRLPWPCKESEARKSAMR